jgi:RNA polymerase sigma factor (sigma-70 family)
VLESFRSESKAASELLFNSNLRLVVSIAKKYGIGTLLDRIQDGNAGLMSAVVRYNPELGFRFSTYATWWIRQSIERELSDKGHFAHFGAQFYYIMRKVNGFLDRNPDKWDDLEAIYSATGVTGEDVAVALRARGLLNPDSLDRKLYDGDDAIDLKSVIPDTSIPDPESVCIYGSSRRNMEQFISLLKKPLDREIITFYYYDGLSFSDIGQKVGLRTEAVKQRHGIALRLLRRIIESR